MRNRLVELTGALTTAIVILAAGLVSVSGQVKSGVPRTVDGHPDLTGMYDLAMLTPLERPAGLPAVLSDAEAAKLEKAIASLGWAFDL